MAKRPKLKDSVVVITGASSGIGEAAALEFAKAGSILVITARNRDRLEDVAGRCREAGAGDVLTHAVDVRDPDSMEAVAGNAVETYGRIDVWINNAGVTLFSKLEQAPMDEIRAVIDTNLLGCIHGARAALPRFREQGHGVLINNSAMLGKIGAPYLSIYAMTKFAIVGFSESLRMEIADAPGIKVCTVLPANIDTPIFQNAANHTGRAVKPMDPVLSVDRCARAIYKCAKSPRSEMAVGNPVRMLHLMHATMPWLACRMMSKQVERGHFQDHGSGPTAGNLFESGVESVSGGWSCDTNGNGGSGKAGKVAAITVAACAGVALAGIALEHHKQKSSHFWNR